MDAVTFEKTVMGNVLWAHVQAELLDKHINVTVTPTEVLLAGNMALLQEIKELLGKAGATT